MTTAPATIAHILDTLADLPGLRAARMFGEYGLYLDTKIVGLICDDTLYLKPTATAHPLLPGIQMAPPYPGAKPHMVCNELLDEPDLAMEVIRAIAADVPEPKPKKPKVPKPKAK
jgi:TfoX/Sxy family transcriptional regulator of competence genes